MPSSAADGFKTGVPSADIQAVIIGWFTRIVVAFAVIGVLGFDSIIVVSAHLGAQEDANNAASDAAVAWQSSHTQPGSLAGAQTAAEAALSHGETIVAGSFHIDSNGDVTLTVHRVADRTLLAHDLGFLRHQIDFDTTGTATPPTS